MKRKRFKSTLTRNYVIAGLAMVLFIILSVVFFSFRIIMHFNGASDNYFKKVNAKDIFNKDYDKMDTHIIEKLDGWVEIVNDQYKIIFTKGVKKDSVTQYNRNELINSYKNAYEETEVVYDSIYAFKTDNGKDYLCIVKYKSPEEQINSILKLYINDSSMPVYKFIIRALIESIIFLLLGTALFAVIFSRITSKAVTKPLKYIREGLDKMTKGDLNTRINFDSHFEFTEIKDSFNYMVEKLQASEEERKRVEESKKRMIMDISHDLRTPITSIAGYSKALYEGIVKEEDKKEKYLRYIYDKSMRMNKLIDDLFRFSKMDGSEYKLNRENYDIVEFLRQIVASHYGEIEESQIELDVELPEKEIIYNFDKTELDRAITNIFANSIKYNPKGTMLTISLEEQEDKLMIRIEDTGIGMSDDLKGKVFDAFVRGETSRKTDGGTGLGLAIARKIVELHGGEISLETEENKGTIFIIKLPIISKY